MNISISTQLVPSGAWLKDSLKYRTVPFTTHYAISEKASNYIKYILYRVFPPKDVIARKKELILEIKACKHELKAAILRNKKYKI
jgi:hypothetical protein